LSKIDLPLKVLAVSVFATILAISVTTTDFLRDTAAQWVMALAAVGALIVSIWAVIILQQTLKMTVRAIAAGRLSTRQTIKTVQENAQRELRAYVSVRPVAIKGLVAGEYPVVLYEMTNTGSTPAYKLKSAASIALMKYPATSLTVTMDPASQPHQVTVFPGQSHQAETNRKHTINQDQIYSMLRGDEYRLYVIGLVTYEDAFGKKRETEFCCIVGGDRLTKSLEGRKPDGWADLLFEFAPFHNAST